ncbi:AAA family ATPase [bacterium]|nr:AAA family ATPase [bacterium]
MSDPITIHALEVENVKRIRAVSLNCAGQSLVVIGGRNGQGKTSLLDTVAWDLGGDRFRPSNPLREGAEKMASKVVLSNGLIVERKGINGALKVTSPTDKGGQQLINEFVSTFALDMPAFMGATDAQKAQMLLDVYPGLGAEVKRLNEDAKRIYGERTAIGQIADRKAKHAAELPFNVDAPEDLLTGTEMTNRLQDALRQNARNDQLRREVESIRLNHAASLRKVEGLRRQLAEAEQELSGWIEKEIAATSAASNLRDADTSELKAEMERIDAINAKVRQNLDRAKAMEEAEQLRAQYNDLTASLEKVRADRIRLLGGVTMPLPELSIGEEGELVYRGARWDCMSGAEQLRVAVAICAAIKPTCGFVLIDGLEQMDLGQLREFAQWLKDRNLQAIGTRVSTGGECSIIIEDGEALPAATADELTLD